MNQYETISRTTVLLQTAALAIVTVILLLDIAVLCAVLVCAVREPEQSSARGPAPAVQVLPEEEEDPEEAEKIEAALLEQGYYREDVPLDFELQDTLRTACEANDIPYEVGLGLIEVESSFRADAVSPAGCYGLCQLNPRYFPSGLSAEENIRTGMAYLAEQLERYGGDLPAALTAYNAGHDTGGRTYADKVLAAAERWAGEER